MDKPVKVRFSRGYDPKRDKYKTQTGTVIQWLLDGVIEVRADKTGKIHKLYQSEYKEI